MTVRILTGHVLDRLADIPDESVHMCVTSPPYYGLRAYNTEPQVWGGDDPACEHEWRGNGTRTKGGIGQDSTYQGRDLSGRDEGQVLRQGDTCLRCNAWRGELGQEPTVALYVAHLVAVFAAVKRVLRKDGVLFVNLGDSYCAAQGGRQSAVGELPKGTLRKEGKPRQRDGIDVGGWSTSDRNITVAASRGNPEGTKPKDLLLVPDRFRIAMQESGWYVRSKMPWVKRSCMPESVEGSRYARHQITTEAWERMTGLPFVVPDGEDTPSRVDCPGCPKCEPNGGLVLSMSAGRPTSAVEDVILFTKSGSYFWDSEAVRRSSTSPQQDAHNQRYAKQYAAFDGRAASTGQPGNVNNVGIHSRPGPGGRHYRTSDMFFDSLGPLLGAADEPEPGVKAMIEGDPTRGETPARIRRTDKQGDSGLRRYAGFNDRWDASGREEANAGPPFPPQGLILDEDGDPLALDVNPAGYDGAHFATFPSKLVRPLILAGTSEKGCCPRCGSPWVRVVEKDTYQPEVVAVGVRNVDLSRGDKVRKLNGRSDAWLAAAASSKTTGWLPSCRCPDPGPPVPCRVLDCFGGSGTTGKVAEDLGRDSILIDLQSDYVEMASGRITSAAPLLNRVDVAHASCDTTDKDRSDSPLHSPLPLFETPEKA